MTKNRWLRPTLAALAFVAATPAHAETKLLLSTFFPSTHPVYAQVLVPWASWPGGGARLLVANSTFTRL